MTCSTCSFGMFGMFLWYVRHVPLTCSACSFSMFNMLIIHAHHVKTTCTYMFFPMFHVPCACSFLVARTLKGTRIITSHLGGSRHGMPLSKTAYTWIIDPWLVFSHSRAVQTFTIVQPFNRQVKSPKWHIWPSGDSTYLEDNHWHTFGESNAFAWRDY